MNEVRQQKLELKRLLKQLKKHPRLYARVASIELELGQKKSAKKRLEKGLDSFPEDFTARTLLAECLSSMGQHEASLKQWEEVIYSEPFNARARAGYVRELAFLEKGDQLADAIADLYGLDPLDDQISDRHQEALLRAMRKADPSIRVWSPQWHPGDFTPIGSTVKSVAAKLELTPEREPLPEVIQISADEAMSDRLIVELGHVLDEEEPETEEPVAESEAPEVEMDDEERALAALLDEEETQEGESSETEPELDEEMVDVDDADLELDEAEPEDSALEEEVAEPEATTELDETAEEPEEAGEETAEIEVEEETEEEVEVEEEIEEEPEPPRQIDSRLAAALKAVDVEADDVLDMEQLVEELQDKEPYIVEEPQIKIKREEKPVEVQKGKQKSAAPKTEEAPTPPKGTPSIEVDVEMDLTPAGGEEVDVEPVHEDLEDDVFDQSTLDSAFEKPADGELTEEAPAEDSESALELDQLSEEELASLADADEASDESPGGLLDQSSLDALVAANKATKEDTPETSVEPEPEVETPPPAEEKKPAAGGKLNQSDLDALIAASKKKAEPESQAEVVKPAEEEEPPPPAQKKAEPVAPSSEGGSLSQSDLDALIAANRGKSSTPPPAEKEVTLDSADTEPEIDGKFNEIVEEVSTPKLSSTEGPFSQDELDAILNDTSKPVEHLVPPMDDSEDDEETPNFEAEELEGDLDQSVLDGLLAESSDADSPVHNPHEDLPGDEVTQNDLDALFSEEVEVSEEETELTQEQLDELFESGNLSKDDEEEEDSEDVEADISTLEDMQRKLDEIELRSEKKKQATPSEPEIVEEDTIESSLPELESVADSEDDDLPGTFDINRVIGDINSSEDAADELPAIDLSNDIEEETQDLDSDLLPGEDEFIEVDVEEEDGSTVTSEPEPETEEKPKPAETKSGLTAEAFAEAMRESKTPPPIRKPRPTPHRSSVEEEPIPPEEFKGPVTKTFAKLCLAQGKTDHASFVLDKLLAENPDDAELLELKSKVNGSSAD